VIEDDGLPQTTTEKPDRPGMKEQRVASEPGGKARGCGMGTVEGSGDLTEGGPGLEGSGQGNQQLRPLEVVRGREGLSREGAAAGETQEAGHDATSGGIRAVVTETEAR